MRKVRELTENEMVLAFLQAELASPNYRDRYLQVLASLNQGEDIIINPVLGSQVEDDVREKLLRAVRGYKANTAIFRGFPTNTNWHLAEMDEEDFSSLLYVAHEKTWRELSEGTRRVVIGAKNILDGTSSNPSIEAVAAALKKGIRYPPIIAIAKEEELVLLEGHTRATAYLVAGIAPVNAIIGSSPDAKNWIFY